jgi:hypothetical protein
LQTQPDGFASEPAIYKKFGRAIRTAWDIGNALAQLEKENSIVKHRRSIGRGPDASGYRALLEGE